MREQLRRRHVVHRALGRPEPAERSGRKRARDVLRRGDRDEALVGRAAEEHDVRHAAEFCNVSTVRRIMKGEVRDFIARPRALITHHASLITAVLFVALSLLMTWPLARNLGTAVCYPGDPFINTWILDWDWYATLRQPLHLFEANAFYPAHDSLAFSENLYGIALLLLPLRAFGMGALAAHNVALLLGFAFCGFAAYLLGRMISGSAWAGVAAGIFYA